MSLKITLTRRFLLCLMLACAVCTIFPQERRPSSAPRIDILSYKIEADLTPEAHELKAAATIDFRALESIDHIVFELSENLSVRRVLNSEKVELEFGQDEIGVGYLSVRFPHALSTETVTTIRIEYQGGFDRDRFSRLYTKDESSAYIGMEETYLMYSAKWFPVNQFLSDRATGTLELTVPLGMTAIGPGAQLPVVTKGISETFGWNVTTPVFPGSFVAGQYFQRKVQAGNFTLECFARENHLDSIQKSAEAAAKILEYYGQTYGPSAAGSNFRLVEVNDQLAGQYGMLGTIFVTHRELAQSLPPVRELARRIAFQWWQETVGVRSAEDLWLADGMAYLSAAQYIGREQGDAAYKEEIDNLAILALKFEKKSAVREAASLGYRTDKYESVAAGKGAWILNMLRGLLGEQEFSRLIIQYAQEYAGKGPSTAQFQKLAEKQSGKELGWFFSEWIDTIGVPEFQSDYVVFKTANGFRISGSIKQDRDLFRMPVEIAVISGKEDVKTTVEVMGKSTPFDLVAFAMPDRIVLDPANKLLRDSKELQTSVQLSLGNDLKQKGDFVDAIRAYESALKLSPNRSIAHFRLAETFYEQFNLQSSANSFRDALNGDRDPKWIEAWCYIYLGKIYDILGQRQRAMAEYTKAVNTKDNTFDAQAEAQKWLATPFTRERTTIETEKKQSD
jgi:aminopeptidase N